MEARKPPGKVPSQSTCDESQDCAIKVLTPQGRKVHKDGVSREGETFMK